MELESRLQRKLCCYCIAFIGVETPGKPSQWIIYTSWQSQTGSIEKACQAGQYAKCGNVFAVSQRIVVENTISQASLSIIFQLDCVDMK